MTETKRIARMLLTVLFLTAVAVPGHVKADYTMTMNGKTTTFVALPSLGYIIQNQTQGIAAANMEAISSLVDTGEIRQAKISSRHGFKVVVSESPNLDIANLQPQPAVSQYAAPLFSVNGQLVAIIPEIVVRIASGSETSLQQQCAITGLTIKQKLAFTRQEYLLTVSGTDANAVFLAVEQLKLLPYVEWATPNLAFKPTLMGQVIPNDQYFSKLWHLNNTGQSGGIAGADVNAPEAWEITIGDPNIIIAIIDTGVDVNHPDLINNMVPGYDFLDDDNIPAPSLEDAENAHGTMCAGLAAACGNNGIGVTGVAWNCKIMPIRIADANYFITDAEISTAMRWAAEHGADILSNSWGETYSSEVLRSAIKDITSLGGIGRNGKGCIVVCAAGNWINGGPVVYPAAYPSAIAVGATDNSDNHWYYSASGPQLDIVAPSGGTRKDYFLYGKAFLWTTDITGIYGYSMENIDTTMLDYSDSMSGTSGACPIVAGTAALVLSAKPTLTSSQVRRVLLDTAVDLGDPGFDEYYGYGRVDAGAAVNWALTMPDETTSYEILYVDDNAPNDPCAGDPTISDPNEDGTQNHPFDSIQKAIDAAFSSETILVADGTYKGMGNYNIDFGGKTVKVISMNGPDNCIIDCQNLGRGFYFHNAEDANSVLEGFTITRGRSTSGGGINCSNGSSPTLKNLILKNNSAFVLSQNGGLGGGIYTDDQNCSPSITDCNFIGNSAANLGGGLFITYGSLTITNCIFNYNYAEYIGGGVFNGEGLLTLDNCVFLNNVARIYDGGAFYDYYGFVEFTNCQFIRNSSGEWGGAFCESWGYPSLQNCLFYGNSANVSGGAIFFDWSDYYGTITNCTFASNTAAHGYGLSFDSYYGPSIIRITNSILWDNVDEIYNNDHSTITITYSDVRKSSGTWTGTGNKNTDPLFANQAKGDCHLKSKAGRWDPNSKTWVIDTVHSPCIDTGNPIYDWTEELWPQGKRINMGAYGGTAQASMSLSTAGDKKDLNGDDLINWDDVLLLIDKWHSSNAPQKQDINRNGIVDANDLMFYYGNWSQDANNVVPVFNVISDQNGLVESPLQFNVSAVDTDGDTLVYAVAGLPEGAVFSENKFEWIPEAAGLFEVTFIVSDNKSLDFVTVKIRINDIQ
jgi:subtilisin family serine protease